MPKVGEQADVLRAVGRLLDDQHATHVEIENHESFLNVSWERFSGGAQQQYLQEMDLETLRANARAMRQGMLRGPGGSFAELLRTLGQELDREGCEVATISEESDGFRVSGSAHGRYFRQLYLQDELLTISARRRAERGGRGPSPFGGRVYTPS